MVKRVADHYPSGMNMYVPAATMAADLNLGGINLFNLGTPAASDDDIVDASVDGDATAGTEEAQSYTSDAIYGRNLIVTPSGDPGATGMVIDVYGKDYLGQPMIERFTVANGSTAIQYGKKAFFTVTKTKIVTAATNAVTAKVGTGTRLGLPYKGDVVVAREDGSFVPLFNRDFMLRGSLSDAEITSGGSLIFRAPCPGYVKTLYGLPSGAGSTTNAATTLEIETTAVTGLSVTMDQDTQTIVSDTPTTVGYNANNRFVAGNRIEIVHAATTGGGACAFEVECTPTQVVLADTTDAATVTTGDPRGTYEPIMTMNGTAKIEVGMLVDNTVNSSGNGGLFGIAHYYA